MRIKRLTKKEYMQICNLLQIDSKTDKDAALFLNSKLNSIYVSQAIDNLRELIANKDVFIFAAGPSLPEAIHSTKQYILAYRKDIVVIAVDGATKALLEQNFPIDLIVTDLDGSLQALRDSYQNNQSYLIIHAHGDNISKIAQFEKFLVKERIIGSTQINSEKNVKNFGGFTDGDRAVYLAANFNASRIFLFAFDFGNMVGKYSKPEELETDIPVSERKKIKLQIAKELLRKIPSKFKKIKFLNCTQSGEVIPTIQNINYQQLVELLNK